MRRKEVIYVGHWSLNLRTIERLYYFITKEVEYSLVRHVGLVHYDKGGRVYMQQIKDCMAN